MQLRLIFPYFHLFLIVFLCENVYSATLTDLCPASTSCNCTLANDTELSIICSSTPSLTELPTLSPSSLQTSIIRIRVRSSVINTKGPLISLPTNICSYPNIAVLDLSSNSITGLLNTSELACLGLKLTRVDFSLNSITDIDSNFFQWNRQIQSVDISQNNLTSMPAIDSKYFVNFPSTFTEMNFSFNQIIRVDLWPLFVKTRTIITIDMSHNLVQNYSNTIPISVAQLYETPDPRYFYLNNNSLTRLSDVLLEQYGACAVTSPISMAYFIVGISNLLLSENYLTCDCESYNLIQYITDSLNDFPDINNGSALITRALCYLPESKRGQQFIFMNFDDYNGCVNYTLPNITDIFCSVYANDSQVTMTTPTYWPTTTTTVTTVSTEAQTVSSSNSSSSSSWFIGLGVVLGVVVVLAVVLVVYFLYKKKMLLFKAHSSYHSNGVQRNNNGSHGRSNTEKHRLSWNGDFSPNQGTQTNFQDGRPKLMTAHAGTGPSSQDNHHNYTSYSSYHKRRLSASMATDASTNTTNIVKGIPISAVKPKALSLSSNNNNTKPSDLHTSQLTIASIPITPSRRAKLLPPVKNAIFSDSANNCSLLNASGNTAASSKRQRARSAVWPRKPHFGLISPLSTRPQSLATQQTTLDSDDSFNDNTQAVPTTDSSTQKPTKSIRTVPLLNISVVSPSAQTDDGKEPA